MKLIRCYIENFGTLSQFEYVFAKGLNTIEEENGWGKSTFAAFIKAMFFGLEYKRGKSITDRDRYTPWNGNRFGGILTFELEGKQYKIERYFGKREKDDYFMLYDLSKNIESRDFTENIGEEIWKVDRDSYEKTAFITLNDMELVNDIISSKLGDINEQEADLERSTMALNILEKLSLEIKPKRGKNGLLGKKEAEQKELKSELKICLDSLREMEIKEGWVRQKEEDLLKRNKEIMEIDKEQSKFALYEKKRHYDFLIQEYQAALEELKNVESFFNGKILSKEEMDQLEEEADAYINQKRDAFDKRLTQDQKRELEELSVRFRNGKPDTNELNQCSGNLTALSHERIKQNAYAVTNDMQDRFQALSIKYGGDSSDPAKIDGMIRNYQQVVQLEAQARDITKDLERTHRESSEKKEKASQKMVFPLLIAGISMLILGILIALGSVVIGGVLSSLGVVFMLFSLFMRNKSKEMVSSQEAVNKEREHYSGKLAAVKKRREELAWSYTTFLQTVGKEEEFENIPVALANAKTECQEYLRLKKEMGDKEQDFKKAEKQTAKIQAAIEAFFSRYSNASPMKDYEEAFNNLRKKVSRFEELKRLEMEYEKSRKSSEEKEASLTPFFDIYYEAFPDSVKTAVLEIREQLTKLEEKQEALNKAAARKLEFENKNSTKDFKGVIVPDKTIEQLKSEKEASMDQKDAIMNEVSNYQKDIDRLSLKADKIEDIESILLKIHQETDELLNKRNLLDLTMQCLKDAKEDLAAKYMEEMSEAFDRYIKKIDPKRNANYHINIKLHVMLEKDGQFHDSSGLSKGMKDLIQICMRMALVEAVYKDVGKPVLVLDDPFVNLDSERLDHAASLLQTIGEDYQIIYFICHSSRRAKTV